jgi:hypothetical protein
MSSNPATTPSDSSVRASAPPDRGSLPALVGGSADQRRGLAPRSAATTECPRGRSGRARRYWLGGRRGRASDRPLVRYRFRSPSWRGGVTVIEHVARTASPVFGRRELRLSLILSVSR